MGAAPKRLDMNREEAQATVDAIRRGVSDIRDLVLNLHDRNGWAALGYDNWRSCVVAEFKQSESYLYRQLQAALIEREISPIGETAPIPEGQIRPLAALPKGTRRETWEEAKATAPEGKVTARHVQETVDRKLGKAPSAGRSRVNGVISADPPDVAKARAEGRIPAEVVVDVTEPEAAEVKESAPESGEAEVSDADWLESLPARAALSGRSLALFDADALTYRRLEKPRGTFHHHASRVLKAARRKGEYGYRVTRFLKTDHPKHWLVCPAPENGGCAGTGQVPLIGECPKCRGRGYWIR